MHPAGDILIIDDELINLTISEKILTDAGYRVNTATTIADCLQTLQTAKPDMILLDIRLRNENGLDLLKQLKSDSSFDHIYVVIISSVFISTDDQARGLELGADGYITRPIERRELVARIDTFFKHKQSLDNLRKSESQLRNIINKNPDAILITNQVGQVKFANPAAKTIFNITHSELLNREIGYPIVIEDFAEVEIFSPDSGIIVAEMRSINIEWEEEAGYLISMRDISQRYNLEIQLRQAQKLQAIGQLAGGVAHNINNIINAISAYAEIIVLKGEQNSSANAEKIKSLCDRASQLTTQLLQFSRQKDLKLENIDVHDCINRVTDIIYSSVDPTIQIINELDAEYHVVLADAASVDNVLLNVCLNARDAMKDREGILKITTKNLDLTEEVEVGQGIDPGKYVEIGIHDNGSGMSPEVIQRIFEPFYTTKNQGKGTGLGLSTVYGTIRQHSGYVTVKSEVGKGTSICLFFKVYGSELEPASKTVPDNEIQSGSYSILLIDDEESIIEPLSDLLRMFGYAAFSYSNGLEALEFYRREHATIDLILLDLVMPSIKGLDCFREIKKIRSDAKVIVTSGHVNVDEKTAVLAEGAYEFISKPFHFKHLTEKISQALGV